MTKFLTLLFVTLFVVALAGACVLPGRVCPSSKDCCGTGIVCDPLTQRCVRSFRVQSDDNSNDNSDTYGYGYRQQLPWRWQRLQAAYNNNNAGMN